VLSAVGTLEPEACYRALKARDERFDGRVFIAVVTTGVYCRPVCPVPAARFENCRFYASAASAQSAGFRPCLRCRPETAPERGGWDDVSKTVARGLALIDAGALDGDDASVERLAARLGVGERHLRRLFQRVLGASPIAVAQTRRVLFAKQLIHDTRLPMTEIAFAAGFGSVRRFNETFRRLYQRPPSALRRRGPGAGAPGSSLTAGVTVRLRYRPPYDWRSILTHLAARAVAGVEEVEGEAYRRVIRHGGQVGIVEVRHLPAAHSVSMTFRIPAVRSLPGLVARARRALDLGADVEVIASHLRTDPLLARHLAERPGLRVPGGWDGFEIGVRSVLGQQVSVSAARKLASTLVQLCGTSIAGSLGSDGSLARAFPTAEQVARADLTKLHLPDARRRALTALAEAAIEDPELFHPSATLEATVARLRRITGIGEWTAQYIALRAAREPDAFPASDVGLLRAMSDEYDRRPTPATLIARAEGWRPWRAYAAQHLWAADSEKRNA